VFRVCDGFVDGVLTCLLCLQVIQVYWCATALSMFVQQMLLRSKAFRKWLDFPSEWPMSAERAKEMAKGQQKNSMLASFVPIFRRFSYLGEFDIKRAITGEARIPSQTYVGKFGLRNPGIPLPPDSPAPFVLEAASVPSPAAASSPVSAAVNASVATTAAIAQKAAPQGAGLYKNRPTKSKR
jgi:hypothetical protein